MSITQAQWLSRFRRHLGDPNANIWTDYDLIDITAMAYEQAWPDWYLEVLDDNTYTGYASLPPGTLSVPVPDAFIGGKIYNIFGRVNQYQRGVAFTGLATSPWLVSTVAHGLGTNQQVQTDGNSLPGGLSSFSLYYTTLPSTLSSLSSISNGGQIWTIVGPSNLRVGVPVTLTGTIPVNFSAGTTYYVVSLLTSTTLTLSATPGGSAITAGSASITATNIVINTSLAFQVSLTIGGVGTGISATSTGSGYVGTYVDSTNDRVPFNQWLRGIRIDPLTSDNPRIRFTKRDSIPFEMRIEGASVLSYPYQTLTANGTDTFTTATGYTPFNGDTMYFYAVAPTSFNSGGLGSGGQTPYYVISTSGQTFKLASTSAGSAISTTSSGTYNIFPGSQVLPGTDSTWLLTFLRGQGEIEARSEKQRSGNLDRRAMAQRRLLAQQDIIEARKHRMQPHISSMFTWDG